MTRTIRKSLMLATVVGAMAAMAIPSMASAANWGPALTNQTLTNGGLGLIMIDAGTTYGLNSCTGGGFGVRTRAPASPTLDINTANSYTCSGMAGTGWTGCNATLTPTGLPWTANGTSTTNVTLNSVNYTVVFTAKSGMFCPYAGAPFTLEGTLTGGVWNNTAGSRSLTYSSDSGLRLKRPPTFDKPVSTTNILNATTLTLS